MKFPLLNIDGTKSDTIEISDRLNQEQLKLNKEMRSEVQQKK